jgi:predicted nucleotidyltransferase
MRTTEDILRPPTEAEVSQALARFAADLRRHYGDRLKGLYLFGSRARGDHGPFSDADVAVVLADPPCENRIERRVLSDLSYERLIEDGVEIQGWPVPASAWEVPDRHHSPSLIRAMRRDARPLDANP